MAWVGAPLLLVVLGALTLYQWDFLEAVGWDPIGRTQTQWPSIMALGPGGGLLTTTFIVASLSSAGLAVSLWLLRSQGADWALAFVCLVLAFGLAGVTFAAALPGDPSTWHSRVHNVSYPFIPLAILLGAAMTARRTTGRRPTASRFLLAVIAVTYPLTSLDRVAQLSRYVLFSALMCWVVLLTMTQQERLDWTRQGRR
jgi:uncharacterized membrane protein YhaH (DUF805 family)